MEPSAPASPSATPSRLRLAAGLASLAAVAGAFAFTAAHVWPFVSDDAFISLRYAERLLGGHGLTFTDGERVEGYSDLAWVLLTAVGGALGFDLLVAARALGFGGAALALAFSALTLERPTRWHPARALTAGLLLAFTPALAVWAMGGLEHGFMAGVAVLATWLLMRAPLDGPQPPRERVAVLSCLALLQLLRADGAGLAGALLLGALGRELSTRHLRRVVGWGLAPLTAGLAQLAFRLGYYDAWVPNTALVKVGFSLARLELGLSHLREWARFGWPWLVAAAVAVPLVAAPHRRRLLVPFTASLAWFAYLAMVGGDIFPAWRQVLLGLAPLVLVVAEGAEAAAARAAGRGPWAAAGLGAGAALLVTGAAVLQRRDPQNERGRAERWEYEGYSLGPFLGQAFGAARPLLAVDAAGALPYFSKLPTLDMLGLNDRYLATHPPPPRPGVVSTGHELGDGEYLWRRKVDLIAVCAAEGGREPCFLGGKQLVARPGFHDTYQLLRYESATHHVRKGELWVRREDGPLAVRRAADRVTVPGWLLAQHSGWVVMEGGVAQARVSPEEPAHLTGLSLPDGRWRVRVPEGLELGLACRDRTLVFPPAQEVVVELADSSRLDVLLGADRVRFVRELVLERTDASATVRCDASQGPARLEVEAAWLHAWKPPGSSWLQPRGVRLDKPLVVRLGPAPAPRYALLVDSNDTHRLEWLAGETVLAEVTLGTRQGGGLAQHAADTPDGATAFRLTVTGGDGRAALAAVRGVPRD